MSCRLRLSTDTDVAYTFTAITDLRERTQDSHWDQSCLEIVDYLSIIE